MKRPRMFLICTLLFTLFLMHSASAEMLTVEVDLSDDFPWTYMLRSGDTLHCLTISSHPHPLKDLSEITFSVAAQCSALENGALVPCQDHCADRFQDRTFQNASTKVIPNNAIFGIAVSPQNRTFLIDGDWAVYEWTPGDAEPWRYLCTLDVSIFDFNDLVIWKSFSADGDTLCACFLERTEDNDETPQGTAFSFSLTSGAGEKLLTYPGLRKMYFADENTVLFKGKYDGPYDFVCWFLYDLASETKTRFSDGTFDQPVSDGHGGWYTIDIGQNPRLCHYGKDGGPGEQLALLPKNLQETSLSLSEGQSTVFVCTWDGYLGIYPLPDGDGEASPELVLAGSLNEYGWNENSLPDISAFSAANNGAQITTVSYPASFDDLALELVSGSDRFDLMVLELSSGNVDSLLDKGYYVDLSDHDSISAYVQNLYSTWRDECLRGNEIVGIPIGMRNIETFMVNLELWEEEGLGDHPKTYDELFDCIREWDSLGVLDEVPLFDRSMSSYGTLHNRIMVDYMGKCKREGRPIVFEDETLLHLLSRLEDVRPILEAHDARNISGDGLFFEGIISNIIHITALYKFEVTADNSTFVPLPLGLTDEEDCVESVFFTMLVVNPNSQRQELAKAYLAYLAEHPTMWTRCYLLQGGPVGVREKGYENLDEQYEQLVSELDEKIAAAMKDGDDAVVNRWELEKKDLTNEYLNMWEVRPNLAEMVYEMMPRFTPLTSDGYGFLKESCDDLTEMFLEGRMDGRTYAMRLDQRMQMMILEGIK